MVFSFFACSNIDRIDSGFVSLFSGKINNPFYNDYHG
jgi:hypothetical protein